MYQLTLDDFEYRSSTNLPFESSGTISQIKATPKSKSASDFQLRPYQQLGVDNIRAEFASGVRATLCEVATGGGKSLMMADLARDFAKRGRGVLLLAHRNELIDQNIGAISEPGFLGLKEKAADKAIGRFRRHSNIVVASVASMKGKRLNQWSPDDFDLILCDEAHHSRALSYRRIFNYFPDALLAGFTATPDRSDNKGLGNIYENVAFRCGITQLLHDPDGPWLVPPVVKDLYLEKPIDLRNLKFTVGDYDAGELEKVINENLGRLVNSIRKYNVLEDRATLAFTPDVESARSLAKALSDMGISAESVSCYDKDRDQIIERFRNREFQVLCNAMLLTEGTNLPFVSCILLLRPTKSRSLFVQMVGRGLRLCPEEGKEDCLIVDVPFLAREHDLRKPIELFADDSDTDDDLRIAAQDRAQEILDSGRENDLEQAWKKALEEEEAEREERAAMKARIQEQNRLKIAQQDVKAAISRYDPLAGGDVDKSAYSKESFSKPQGRTPTEPMCHFLRSRGIYSPEKMSFAAACGLITKLKKDESEGRATYSQVNYLCSLGMKRKEAQLLSNEEAKLQIDALLGA